VTFKTLEGFRTLKVAARGSDTRLAHCSGFTLSGRDFRRWTVSESRHPMLEHGRVVLGTARKRRKCDSVPPRAESVIDQETFDLGWRMALNPKLVIAEIIDPTCASALRVWEGFAAESFCRPRSFCSMEGSSMP
jgi:hypothetical protein